MMKLNKAIAIGVFFALPLTITAQNAKERIYTEDKPLVYEDVWDLWPYCFLNENGEPDGFNIELIRLILKELDIPYTIKLKSRQDAFNDLRDGKSDLTMALSAGYHDEYGQYGQNTITLFTQSVATPKNKPIEIYNLKDLGKYKVIVNDNSLAHHLMEDYGWLDNAIPTKDIRGAIRTLSVNEEGQILWNTLSLKWIIHQYQIENLNVTPVNMPHGEYKFMSNDPLLLAKLDSAFTALSTDEKLLEMQNKWFYPERQEKHIPTWVWYLVAIGGVLALIMFIIGVIYRTQAQRINKANERQNKRLALIMRTSKLRMWTFDVQTQLFSWHNDNGQVLFTYSIDEFAQRYSPEDFEKLRDAIKKLTYIKRPKNGEEENITLQLKALDSEDGDKQLHDFMVTLSVLRRDEEGKPAIIIGTKKDITSQQASIRASEEHLLRYWAIFNTPMLGIVFFDRDGKLNNINQKACDTLGLQKEEVMAQQLDFHELLDIPQDITPEEANGYKHGFTQLQTVRGDHDELIGVFAFMRDNSPFEQKQQQLQETEKTLDQKNKELSNYIDNINYILERGAMRLVSYSPTSHTITIYRKTNQTQLVLTQTRCMTFIDNRHQRKVIHMLNDMDDRLNKKLQADIKTNIRIRGGLMLYLQFQFFPVKDKDGQITEYSGLCLDISELKKSENLMMLETIKAQEIEHTQNKFLNNMLQEIRTPLNIVVELAGEIKADKPDDNDRNTDIILNNVNQLLYLINNILYMSRLEAHMVEINKQPADFAEVFRAHCMNGWSQYRRDSVRYIVESPYENLVVDIDESNLGVVIERLIALSARNTHTGSIRARYDYIGRKLMIFIEDTGIGISKDVLQHIQKEFSDNTNSSDGLNLSICKELIDQMGGTFDINSEQGLGTTVWITLPCQASSIKRRKII